MFAFLGNIALPKWDLLLKESKFFSLRIDPTEKGSKN